MAKKTSTIRIGNGFAIIGRRRRHEQLAVNELVLVAVVGHAVELVERPMLDLRCHEHGTSLAPRRGETTASSRAGISGLVYVGPRQRRPSDLVIMPQTPGSGIPGFDRSPTLSGGATRYPAAAPGRFLAAVETPLWAWPGKWADGPSRLYARSSQPILYVGVDAAGSCKRDRCPDFRVGPEVRGVMPIARINSAVYLVAGDRRVSAVAQGTHWAPHYGGGLEIGFGLLYLGVRVEGDRLVSNRLVGTYSRLTVTPTLSASIPWRRHRKELDSADWIVR